MYYLLSIKWTSKKDSWFSFWRANGAGYCWFQEWMGVYTEEEAEKNKGEGVLMVEKDRVDALLYEIVYEGTKRKVLPNNIHTRIMFNIKESVLRPAKYAIC